MSYTNVRTFATLPRTTRGQHIILGGDPKGNNFLYCSNKSVIIRDIADPAKVDIYSEHSVATQVAKYSPSGFYIASGDASGKLRIWDTVNAEHILKAEYPCIGGAIKDISWSADSTKIVVGGEGRDTFTRVMNMDTGTSVGEICGHSKMVNAVAYRPTRPFRIATASEDCSVGFFEGPPFKFKHTNQDHTRFATAVQYSPDGSVFASASMDGSIHLFDGKTGEKLGVFGEKEGGRAHKGGVYGLYFNDAGTHLLSASGDKTCKIWLLENRTLETDFPMGSRLDDMQVGCLWKGNYLISVSLSGNINYLDRENPSTPSRVVTGHNKPVTALTLAGGRLFSGSSDGRIVHWDPESGANDVVVGDGFEAKDHINQIQGLVPKCDAEVCSIGLDDELKVIDVKKMQFISSQKMPSQPRGLDVSVDGAVIAVACCRHILVILDGKVTTEMPFDATPSCVSINPTATEIAVGADSLVYVFSLAGDGSIQEKRTIGHQPPAAVTAIGYSPNGEYLAAADLNRKVRLYELAEGYKNVVGESWSAHTAKINCLAWCPDSVKLATGSIDTNVVIWNTEDKTKNIKILNAHRPDSVNAVCWLNEKRVASVGHDANLKIWEIQ